MQYRKYHLEFKAESSDVDGNFLYPNSAWEVRKMGVTINIDFEDTDYPVACVEFMIRIKRRPNSIVFTIILPEMFISLLNIMVFFIPVESGEKISYGITVLLAQSVFMTILMDQLPKSSTVVPKLSIYMFSLICIAAFSVLISIIVVLLHRKLKVITEKKPKICIKHQCQCLAQKQGHSRQIKQTGFKTSKGDHTSDTKYREDSQNRLNQNTEKWVSTAMWLNTVSCSVSFLGWISITMWYIVEVIV